MSVNLIFKIAAVGILVTVISQVLKHSGREEHSGWITGDHCGFPCSFYQKLQKRIQHFNQHCGMYLHLYLSDRKIGACIVLHQ